MEIKRVGMVVMAAICSAFHTAGDQISPAVCKAAFILLGLLVLDFLTAYWSACLNHKLRSTDMRTKTAAKVCQYFAICGIGCAAWAFTGQEIFFTIPASLCALTEIHSVTENALCLQDSGVDLGPFRPFLDRVGSAFAVAQPKPGPDIKVNPAIPQGGIPVAA